MKTETEPKQNKYVDELREKDLDITAGNLLHIMRPEVEKILILSGHTTPPSQSARAKSCLGDLARARQELVDRQDEVMDQQLTMRQRMVLSKTEHALKDFLAVNRTVWILEGRPV